MTRERPLILIVDDESGNIVLLERYLAALEYQTISAVDGHSAIELVKSQHPDLVLLDIMMPEINGYEVCKAIKSDPATSDAIVIFVSAKADLEDRVEGLEIGGHDYIIKPFHLTELRARIQAALRTKELQDKLKDRNEQLADLAVTDELTGLRNKRYLLERMDEEVSRVRRYGSTLSCLMIDIDHFKDVNDSHGHPVGDLVLRELAQLMHRTLRSVDIAARYGGDEFLVLLPQTSASGAIAVAERIRRTIEEARFRQADPPLCLTVSIGVATISDSRPLGPDQLLQRVDRALYQAKGKGRNHVVVDRSDALETGEVEA